MILSEFVENFICKNSLVRLLFEEDNCKVLVHSNWDKVSMEHQIINKKGINGKYWNFQVIGICDILVKSKYPEAINIVLKKKTKSEIREERLIEIN